jgi:hypothetical protein
MEHALPRTWSLCMTSENHGTVGPAGCKFSHAPDKHERVLVVEVPAAAGAPVDQVNLQLVASAGRQAAVDRALRAAQAWVNEEYMCGRRMGKGEPAMSDQADEAKTACTTAILALATPVAAQAAQVAPAEELARFCPECGHVGDVGPAFRDCCPDGNESRRIPKRLAEKCHELFKVAQSTMRAAAPASPAQAAPLPTPYISINENIQFQHLLLDAMIGAKNGSIATTHSEKIKALTDFIDAAMQASTSGERQEGGAA